MKLIRIRALLLAIILAVCCASCAAEGITLRTVSCFAGDDSAAGVYVDILNRYESETGNTVRDTSSTSDEAWKSSVLNDFAAGNEPDILFFFAAGADSAPLLSRVVPLNEINAAYPEIRLTENDALRESDGKIYAVPVRGYWEGLYVHTDMFEKYGAPLPENWDSLLEAIRVFRENGITPIAVSLSDIPHYLAEMAVLSCAEKEEQQARPRSMEEVPESWLEAMRVIRELTEAGAFADNAAATYESASTAQFLAKEAAMQFDGSWMASSISQDLMDTVAVLPMPRRNGNGTADCYIGGLELRTPGRSGPAAGGPDKPGQPAAPGEHHDFRQAAGIGGTDAGGEGHGQSAAGRHEQECPGSVASGVHSGGGERKHDGGRVLGKGDGAFSFRRVR